MITLETSDPNVLLRELGASEAAAYFRETETRSNSGLQDPNQLRFGIWRDDSLLGSVGLAPDGVDAEVSYALNDRHVGGGYAAIAVGGLTTYGDRRYAQLHANVRPDNQHSIGVFERCGYNFGRRIGDMLQLDHESPNRLSRPVGVLKRVASVGARRGTDSHTYDGTEANLDRMVKSFAGKKNRALQAQLFSALSHIALHPKGDGSRIIRSAGSGSPTFNHEHTALWRFKSSEAQERTTNFSALREVRVVYSLLYSRINKTASAIAVLDIISRGNFEKKYT